MYLDYSTNEGPSGETENFEVKSGGYLGCIRLSVLLGHVISVALFDCVLSKYSLYAAIWKQHMESDRHSYSKT